MDLVNGGRPFRSAESAELGFSRKAMRTAIASGRLVRPVHGVCLDARVPVDQGVRASALALVVPDGVVVTGSTAAWLHGVEPQEPNTHLRPPVPELSSSRGGAAPRRTGCLGAARRIREEGIVQLGAVLATGPATTLIDLVRSRDRPDALAYADAFLRAGVLTREQMLAEVELWAGHRGVEQAREITGLADPRAESAGESWTRLRYVDGGFPPAVPQLWVCDARGIRRYRLDLGLESEQAGVEYDGEQWHGPEQAAYDLARSRWLDEQGWRTLNVGRREVLGRGHAFEQAVGELLGITPRRHSWEYRRRTRHGLPWPSRGAISA